MRELLIDFHVVEKLVLSILMNHNSKDNENSSRYVKRRSKFVNKLRNSAVITITYIQIDKKMSYPYTMKLP